MTDEEKKELLRLLEQSEERNRGTAKRLAEFIFAVQCATIMGVSIWFNMDRMDAAFRVVVLTAELIFIGYLYRRI